MHSKGCGAASCGRIKPSLRMARGCLRQLLSLEHLQTENDEGQVFVLAYATFGAEFAHPLERFQELETFHGWIDPLTDST